MPAPFASFKTKAIHSFWIIGSQTPITGSIQDIEFIEVCDPETGDNGVETFLIIKGDTEMYRVNLKAIIATSEPLPKVA